MKLFSVLAKGVAKLFKKAPVSKKLVSTNVRTQISNSVFTQYIKEMPAVKTTFAEELAKAAQNGKGLIG